MKEINNRDYFKAPRFCHGSSSQLLAAGSNTTGYATGVQNKGSAERNYPAFWLFISFGLRTASCKL